MSGILEISPCLPELFSSFLKLWFGPIRCTGVWWRAHLSKTQWKLTFCTFHRDCSLSESPYYLMSFGKMKFPTDLSLRSCSPLSFIQLIWVTLVQTCPCCTCSNQRIRYWVVEGNGASSMKPLVPIKILFTVSRPFLLSVMILHLTGTSQISVIHSKAQLSSHSIFC